MNRLDVSAQPARTFLHWLKIKRLYRSAFPPSERKPFAIIRAMQKKGKTDVWYFSQGGRFAGFSATINGDHLILLDYLAVPKSLRSRGIGTGMLERMKEFYAGKGFFVEIESVHEKAGNLAQRMRRKQFYENSGFVDLHVTASVFGVNMDLLGVGCEMDFARYRAFYRDNYNPWAADHIQAPTTGEAQ